MIRSAVALFLFLVLAAASCADADRPTRPSDRRLSAEEFRVLAMELLQRAALAEMSLYRSEGRFTQRPVELAEAVADQFVVTSGVGAPGRVSVEVCGGDRVVILGTEAGEGSVFVVKVRGFPPTSASDGVFSHYTQDPQCDSDDGPESWPNGYRVTRRGLVQEAAA